MWVDCSAGCGISGIIEIGKCFGFWFDINFKF